MTTQPSAPGTPADGISALPHLTVVSFGFKHGPPPADPVGHGGFLFDCRALPNPFWEEALRPLSGRDERIQAWMTEQPDVAEFLEHALSLVRYTARTYRQMERPSLFVSLGCTGGYHRSVYVAERLAAALRIEGFDVDLQHRDLANRLAAQPM